MVQWSIDIVTKWDSRNLLQRNMHFRVSDYSYTTDAWPHRLNYLASPNITFRGTPTGRADRDSRRAHIERKVDRDFLANFVAESGFL